MEVLRVERRSEEKDEYERLEEYEGLADLFEAAGDEDEDDEEEGDEEEE